MLCRNVPCQRTKATGEGGLTCFVQPKLILKYPQALRSVLQDTTE